MLFYKNKAIIPLREAANYPVPNLSLIFPLGTGWRSLEEVNLTQFSNK